MDQSCVPDKDKAKGGLNASPFAGVGASEYDSHGELHDARVAGGRDISRRSSGIDPCRVELALSTPLYWV